MHTHGNLNIQIQIEIRARVVLLVWICEIYISESLGKRISFCIFALSLENERGSQRPLKTRKR